ncbi:mitochondrial outer membrane translocase complex, subunit Tom5 [Astrocystis sublimbata]|nr:mitochondrial outer membrane translocase complex, subunit Tom5 [Astrocystis sublimbata]
MFGGFAPPQISAEEIRQLEAEANFTVKQFLTTAVILYISPFVVDAFSGVTGLF